MDAAEGAQTLFLWDTLLAEKSVRPGVSRCDSCNEVCCAATNLLARTAKTTVNWDIR